MRELYSTTVAHAIEDKIHEWLPEITIMRPDGRGGFRIDTVTLNVFRERGGKDRITGAVHKTNDASIYPYVFIEQLSRSTVQRQRIGLSVRYFYDYLMAVRFYVNIDPYNRDEVPLLQEELDNMELKLERVLQELDMWGDTWPTTPASPSYKSEAGVLHTFMTVSVSEDTIPPEYPKIEEQIIKVSLKGDEDEQTGLYTLRMARKNCDYPRNSRQHHD